MGKLVEFNPKSGSRSRSRETSEPSLPDDGVELTYDPRPGSVGVSFHETQEGFLHLTVTVPGAEVADVISMACDSLERSFGADPDDPEALAGIREKMGDVAFASYVTIFVQQHYFAQAMLRVGLIPYLDPEFITCEGPVVGEDYKYEVETLLRPDCSLASYEPVTVELPQRKDVSDVDVDEYLANVAKEMGEWDQSYGKRVPAIIDDDWVARNMPEAGDLAGLRAGLTNMLRRQADEAYREELGDRCVDELVGRLVESPEEPYIGMVKDQLISQYYEDLERRGVSVASLFDNPDFDRAEFEARMGVEAVETLRRSMALDALSDYLDIQLVESDIARVVARMAPGREQQTFQSLLDSGQMHKLCEIALRDRALQWLIDNAKPRPSSQLRLV